MRTSSHLPSRRAAILASAAALMPFSRSRAQEGLEKVKLGSLRFVSSGAVFIALERGYFRDEGLDVLPASSTPRSRSRSRRPRVISTSG